MSARIRPSRFGTSVPFGLNARQQNAWFYQGGGNEAAQRVPVKKLNIHYHPSAIPAPRWVAGSARRSRRRRPQGPEDAHRRPRRPGHEKLGVVPQQIAGGDIYPALEKGTIDAPSGSAPMTTRSSASTRSRRTTTIPAGGKAARPSTPFVNKESGTACRTTTSAPDGCLRCRQTPACWRNTTPEPGCAEANWWLPARSCDPSARKSSTPASRRRRKLCRDLGEQPGLQEDLRQPAGVQEGRLSLGADRRIQLRHLHDDPAAQRHALTPCNGRARSKALPHSSSDGMAATPDPACGRRILSLN
jgi:hypothetical protein